jgi:hypothetical protein
MRRGAPMHADHVQELDVQELDPAGPDPAQASEQAAFALLRAGVPLSLLLDLALPTHSRALLDGERADTSWVPRRVVA